MSSENTEPPRAELVRCDRDAPGTLGAPNAVTWRGTPETGPDSGAPNTLPDDVARSSNGRSDAAVDGDGDGYGTVAGGATCGGAAIGGKGSVGVVAGGVVDGVAGPEAAEGGFLTPAETGRSIGPERTLGNGLLPGVGRVAGVDGSGIVGSGAFGSSSSGGFRSRVTGRPRRGCGRGSWRRRGRCRRAR